MYGIIRGYNFIVGKMTYAAEIVHRGKLIWKDTNSVLFDFLRNEIKGLFRVRILIRIFYHY